MSVYDAVDAQRGGIVGYHRNCPTPTIKQEMPQIKKAEVVLSRFGETQATVLRCEACGHHSLDGQPFDVEICDWLREALERDRFGSSSR